MIRIQSRIRIKIHTFDRWIRIRIQEAQNILIRWIRVLIRIRIRNTVWTLIRIHRYGVLSFLWYRYRFWIHVYDQCI